jgi:hypothetical protein
MLEETTGKRWSRKAVAVVLILVVVGSVALYLFIIDPLIHYELLELYRPDPYVLVSNHEGQVTMVHLSLVSNGTKTATIDRVWVNGTLVDNSDLRWQFPNIVPPGEGTELFVFPKDFIFQREENYNITLGTTSGKTFTFILPIDDAYKKQENLTITGLDFIRLPDEPDTIFVKAKNGPTTIIVTHAWVNGTEATIGWGWIDPGGEDFSIYHPFSYNNVCVVQFETAAGNIYEFTGTAIHP